MILTFLIYQSHKNSRKFVNIGGSFTKKGDGHLKFSGEPRTLLRNLTSYNGQILHELRFFVKDSESTKVEAVRPL